MQATQTPARSPLPAPLAAATDAWLARLLMRRNPSGQILDLGCGDGRLHELVPIRTDRYLGIDAEPGAINRARERHPGYRFRLDDPASLATVPPASIGCALSLSGAFAEWLDPASVFRELRRVLIRGGRFLIVTAGARAPETALPSAPYLLHTPATIRRALWSVDLALDRIAGLAGPLAVSAPDLLRLDAATIGRAAPELCRLLVIEGRRV